jgi:predicted CXXCH cytochrome family protein
LHWTGPYKTWNARCAECHATGYRKNYDPRTRRHASTQAERGVGCEACHGPGAAHAGWARGADPSRWSGLTAEGLTIGFAGESAEIEIQQCAGCHARREPFADDNPLPGTPFQVAYRLALLRDGLYHADGAIEDEVYVYGSFLQSKMYARGVRCSDCHYPHTARLKAADNALCVGCHSPAGNSRFPSLRHAIYDSPSHHFHAPGSDGAVCKSCHMSERVYIGIDGQHDHWFRVPRPDLSVKTGAPNACTDCHADRSATWAAAITGWFPGNARRGRHFSPAFAAARNHPEALTKNLLAIADDDGLPGIVRASALDLIGRCEDALVRSRVAPLIGDDDPLVRAAVIGVLSGAENPADLQPIVPALKDEYMAVRIAAAPITQDPRCPWHLASGEWRASLWAKADCSETHMVIGGTALVLRDPPAAERAFREALRQDPQLIDAWTMVIRIRAAVGDREGAHAATLEALGVNPNDPALVSMLAQFDKVP